MADIDSKPPSDAAQTPRPKRVWKPEGPARKAKKREYDKRRYAALRDQYIEYSKTYAKRHPEKRSLYAQTQNHLRKLRTREGMTSRELDAWRKAQVKVCYWCDRKCENNFTVDHYVALSNGGKHEAANLVIACHSCNARKRDKDPIQFAHERGRLL